MVTITEGAASKSMRILNMNIQSKTLAHARKTSTAIDRRQLHPYTAKNEIDD